MATRIPRSPVVLASLIPLTLGMSLGCGGKDDGGGVFDSASGGVTATATDGSASGTGTTDPGDGDGDSEGDGDGDGDGDGAKFDVEGSDLGQGNCNMGDGECGCSFVDLVFVIDNSASMGDYQLALGLAFPQFAQTLIDTLPPGTNVHVGVTSTEMGYSGGGSTSINNGVCEFTGDGGLNEDGFYITPDQTNSMRNGAQGRLYKPGGGGQPFFEFDTDGGGAQQAALEDWFSQAAAIGTGGSNIEMLTAPAGWVADPANDDPNDGFIRDEGAVMVVFFMQDEPDQTPMLIDGQPGGEAMLSKLATAKQSCGGVDCIVAGGFLNDNACGGRPIDEFLDGLPDMAHIADLPDDNLAEDDPQAAADEMNDLLSNTLAEVIGQKCDEIPPVG